MSTAMQGSVVVTKAMVRESVATARTHLEQAAHEVAWQIENRAWETLGYASWDDMREGEYGGAAVMVPRQDRPELVARLRRTGLSQQQIGDTLGVAQRTVSGDLNSNPANQPATITNSRGQERPTTYTRRKPDDEKGPRNTWTPEPEPEPDYVTDQADIDNPSEDASGGEVTPPGRVGAATVLLGLGGQHESLGAAVEAGVFTPVHERAS